MSEGSQFSVWLLLYLGVDCSPATMEQALWTSCAVPTHPVRVHVAAASLPATPSEVADLAPDAMVVVSTGCEERCGTHVHKRLVRLSSYMSALTSTAGSSEYMKQQQLGELLTQGGRPKWRCDAFDRPWQHCWSAALV